MTFSLYECLKVVGLQRYYDRFSSAGICHVAHLSAVTTEDYTLLGIHSMRDRTRLFELVQVLKSLDLEDDYNPSPRIKDRGYTEMSKNQGKLDTSHDEEEKESFAGVLSICRQLEFAEESPDCAQMQFHNLTDSVDVYTSDKTRAGPVPGKGPAVPVQVYPVCPCRRNNNCTSNVSFSSADHQMGQHVYPGVARGNYFCNSDNELPSKAVLLPRTKVSPKTKAITFGQKDKKKVSRQKHEDKQTDSFGPIRLLSEPGPIYEAKTFAANRKQTGVRSIFVCVRKRPLTQAERRRREADVVTTSGGQCVIVHETKEAVDLTHYILQHRFHFDRVFGEESSNEDVYKRTTYPLVQHMLKGGTATCFAYGQTGAGKTHTMLGSCPKRPGMYVLAAQDIFNHLSTTRNGSPLQVFVSFYEIYCGQLYDLLDHRKRLFAREDGQKVVHISGLRYVKVASIKSMLEVISRGTEERTQGASGVNPFSSRSHALLQIQLRHPSQQIAGRMWFVDLAGSERASDSKDPNKLSRIEGAEINQSLLALKECIRSLDREKTHTPFRQSKLTQVLKDSFVGDSMTCMIANISPSHTATENTLNTLRYADRVKELRSQGRDRGRKTDASQKHILSNNNASMSKSSVTTQRKPPPKKLRVGGQSSSHGPMSSKTGSAILCSTPKNNMSGNKGTLGRKWIEFEHVTPVKGWTATSQDVLWSKAAGERKNQTMHTEEDCCLGMQNIAPEVMVEQMKNEQPGMWEIGQTSLLPESPTSSRERENENGAKKRLKHASDGGNGEDRKWVELRRQIENHRDTRGKTETFKEGHSQKERIGDNEREQHLRRYHQQLQQFSSLSTSVSLQRSSNYSTMFSSGPSFSSSFTNLQDVVDSASAWSQVSFGIAKASPSSSSGVIPQHTVSSHACSSSSKCLEETHGGVVGINMVETGVSVIECKGSHKATGEARVKKDDNVPAGMEIQGRRRAWVTTQETNRMTDAISTNVASHVLSSGSLESRVGMSVEQLGALNVPSGNGRAADDSSLGSAHCSSLSDLKSRPPAERPLSPTHEHTSALTSERQRHISPKSDFSKGCLDLQHLQFQKCLEASPSNRQTVSKLGFTANASRPHCSLAAALPVSTSVAQNGCKAQSNGFQQPSQPPVDLHAQKCLPKEECTESQSSTMDPLRLSWLQADQTAVTVSFLRGSNTDISIHLLDNGSSESHSEMTEGPPEEGAGETHTSHLGMPQPLSRHATTSSLTAAPTSSETSTIGRMGGNEPKEDLQSFPNDQQHQAPTYSKSPLKCQNALMLHVPQVLKETTSSSLNRPMTNAGQIVHESAHDTTSITEETSPKALPYQLYGNRSIALRPHSSRVAANVRQPITGSHWVRPSEQDLDLDHMDQAWGSISDAQLEQLKQMEALTHKEGKLLSRQPDMAFGEYINKLGEIVEAKAVCVNNLRAQLLPFLEPIKSSKRK